jgi:peptidyl-prolyl cis-trans isomerase D
MRGASNKLIAKIFLFILSASFVFWGVAGNIMTGSNVALTVAGRQISVVEVDRELRRQVAQMQSIMGTGFDARQAVRMGFLSQVVDNMIWRELLDAQAERMYLIPSDAQIYEMIIKSYPEFQDDQGNFSAERFAFLLRSNNISEREFVNVIARELARATLGATLTSSLNTDFLASMMASAAAQERVVDVAIIKFDSERITARPTEEELQAIYESARSHFMEPEFRRISLITVTEATARKKRPGIAAEAVYSVMIEIAENIIDEKNGGSTNEQLAKNFGAELLALPPVNTDGNLRTGARANARLTPRLRDIAFFALDPGGISDLQDVGETIVLVVLDEVIAAAPKPMADVRAELVKFWTRQQQMESAGAKAAEMIRRLFAGEGFADAGAAVDKSMQFRPNLKLTRAETTLPHDVLQSVFAAEKDKPFSVRARDGHYILTLKSVRLPDATPTDEQKEEARELMKSLVLSDYISWLERRLGVKRNEAVLRRFEQ